MKISRMLFLLIVPICLMSIACASVPVQNSSVTSMERTSIEVPRYITRTIYLYTLKGEIFPQKTYNRAEVPSPAALVEIRADSPEYKYGRYATVAYWETQVEEQDGTQTVNGFQVTLNNGDTFFVGNDLQQNFQLKTGSNVEYKVSKSGTTIVTVDGKYRGIKLPY